MRRYTVLNVPFSKDFLSHAPTINFRNILVQQLSMNRSCNHIFLCEKQPILMRRYTVLSLPLSKGSLSHKTQNNLYSNCPETGHLMVMLTPGISWPSFVQ
jgi:hypothetical protein